MVYSFFYFDDLNLQEVTHESSEVLRELIRDRVFPFGSSYEIIYVLSYFLDKPLLYQTCDDSFCAGLANVQDISHFLFYRSKGPQDELPVQAGKIALLINFLHERDGMLGSNLEGDRISQYCCFLV